MFRDAKEELQRLEDELLDEEDIQEEEDLLDEEYDSGEEAVDEEDEFMAELEELVGGDPEAYDEDRVYNNDAVTADDLSRELLKPQKEKLTGLIIAALLLFTAILGVLIWWIVQVPPELWKALWSR